LTVGDVLKASTEYLARKGVPSPRVDAQHLVARALCLSRLDLYLQHDRPLTDAELSAARELVRRRGTREPLAYVLGDWDVRRLTLTTDRRALIPRTETEIVVDRCLALLDGAGSPEVLDVGTGSGAIALAIASEHPGVHVVAIDASEDALALAAENAERTGLADRVTLGRHDLLIGLPGGPYDLVVSNPPYVLPEEIETLEPEVRDWEPRLATVGAEHTEAVALGARAVLEPGGHVVLEVAAGRGEEIADLLRKVGYDNVRAGLDLAGRDRVVEGRWPTSRM
jgi:release factor glutamine methyltransferase